MKRYEIQDDEGKRKVINKESLQLCKPKYMDWTYKRKETNVIVDGYVLVEGI